MKKMIKKNSKLFLLGFLVIALSAAVVVVQKVQETRRGATGTGLPVIVSPASGSYQPGDIITAYVDIGQPSGKVVSTFILQLNYDSNLLDLVTASSAEVKGGDEIIIDTFNKDTPGVVNIVGGINPFVSGNLRAVKLQFEAKAEGSASVTLDQAVSRIVACVSEGSSCQVGSDEMITDLAFGPATYTIGGGGGDQPEITVSLSPAQGEKKINQSFQVDFSAASGENKISSFEAIFTFDQNQLEVTQVDIPIGSDTPFDSILINEVSNGRVRLSAKASRSDGKLKKGNLLIASFTLKGKQAGVADLVLDSISFAGIGAGTGSLLDDAIIRPTDLRGSYSISGTVVDCTPPDYRCFDEKFQECTAGIPSWHNHPSGADCIIEECTKGDFRCYGDREQECDTGSEGSFWRDTGNTCTLPPGTPKLTFTVKFDEVSKKIPDQTLKVVLKKEGRTLEEFSAIVVSDEQGLLTGTVDLLSQVQLGSGYYLVIKGPKHIAERYCLEGQATYCPAGQTLTLIEDSVFDFSGWPLRPGDITGADGIQDGKIDSLDWTYLVEALISDDEEVRERANLNYSLQADGSQVLAGDDIRLFVKTMGTKYDDDY